MVLPEELEHLPVVGDGGVVVHVQALGVPAEAVVGRVDLVPAGIPDPGPDDALGTSELGLGEPESGHGEGGLLGGHRGVGEGHGGAAEVADLREAGVMTIKS